MQKLIILLLLFVASNCVYLRKTNYNETLLNECLGNEKLTLDNGLKELLQLYNQNRFFLLERKFDTMNLIESSKKLIEDCFSKYGIYNQFGDCTRNCHDKCDFYNRDDKDCYKNCPIC